MGMAAGEAEVLLVVVGLMDWGSETKIANMFVDIKEGDMGSADILSKLNRIAIVEVFKQKENGITAVIHNRKITSTNLSQRKEL